MQAYRARNGQKGFERSVRLFLSFLLLIFFAVLACVYVGYDVSKLRFLPTVLIFTKLSMLFGALLLGCVFLAQRFETLGVVQTAALIFSLALIPRILFGFTFTGEQISDFGVYQQLGQAVVWGHPQFVADVVKQYQIREFAGLAVLNGLLGQIFSATTEGYQLASAVMTSFICVAVWLLGSQISRRVGYLAALMYCFYPASLVNTQLLTNQHCATLFGLLSIFVLYQAVKTEGGFVKTLSLGALSSLLLTASHLCHPSSITTRIAFVCYLVVLCIAGWRQKKRLLRLIALLLCVVLVFTGALTLCLSILEQCGYLYEGQQNGTVLSHIVVGLNPETKGAYSKEDYAAIAAVPAEEQGAFALRIIKERLSDVGTAAKTLLGKTISIWVKTDNSFIFYEDMLKAAANQTESPARIERLIGLNSGLEFFDALYLTFVFAFAAVGIWLREKRKPLDITDLFVWVLLGWIGAQMLNEAQSRYRYFAMPFVMIFAAIGISRLLECRKAKRMPDKEAKPSSLRSRP